VAHAHTPNAAGRWHGLVEHLEGSAERAECFGAGLGAPEAAHYLGLWHDIGKYSGMFQAYLQACATGKGRRGAGGDHKAAGAELAYKHVGLLAMAAQGHHGGLRAREGAAGLRAWLAERATDPGAVQSLARASAEIVNLEPREPVDLPEWLDDPLAAETFVRLMFSALVDADFLDTEAHFDPAASGMRGADLALPDLWRRFEANHATLPAGDGPVADVRARVYAACLAAAAQPPGLFRLTVPTGGGKTLSAMAFALRHAINHGLDRVIVAVPFLTITEQTADVYRWAFGPVDSDDIAVLEHHSGVVEQSDKEGDQNGAHVRQRLAAENWDAPIVVTTTIQLFDSLFAAHPGRCRKLHRLARSVIVLDEAQALPPHLLTPILDAVTELVRHYGATVVLSTATQPAFEAIPVFRRLQAREIVPNPERHFAVLRRVRFEWPNEPWSWAQVAQCMADAPQALAVVNSKADALALLDALGDPDAMHLSTLLCGAHRRVVIGEVRRRLGAGEPCRLVSTQVVEAGVDLDFPLVLRARGPLDSIIQAAGRCNREGRLAAGSVVVFRPEAGHLPSGSYRTAADLSDAVVNGPHADPNDPETVRRYFEQLFGLIDTDRERIQERRSVFDYPEVEARFRMIDEPQSSVVVRYGPADQVAEIDRLLAGLRSGSLPARIALRRLQPFIVQLDRRRFDTALRHGLANELLPGVAEWFGGYDAMRGLIDEGATPADLVV